MGSVRQAPGAHLPSAGLVLPPRSCRPVEVGVCCGGGAGVPLEPVLAWTLKERRVATGGGGGAPGAGSAETKARGLCGQSWGRWHRVRGGWEAQRQAGPGAMGVVVLFSGK